jgi:hypothetical protein
MRLPVIAGTIDRRMLINFRADPTVVAKLLPAPFVPKIYRGSAIVGICLIRLKHVRVKGLPEFIGCLSPLNDWTEFKNQLSTLNLGCHEKNKTCLEH